MKIAVMNFSGNVGKSTAAQHLLLPRLKGAELVRVESINSDGGESGAIRGRQFGELQEFLLTADSAVVDVGASNVEDFVKLMKQYHGSHEDFDLFVVPTVKDLKQQRDTMATVDALAALGVPAKKIRILFNKVDVEDNIESVFSGLFAYQTESKRCTIRDDAVIHINELFERIKGSNKTIAEILADDTDYKAAIKNAPDQDAKLEAAQMVALKRLAVGVSGELDAVYKALVK